MRAEVLAVEANPRPCRSLQNYQALRAATICWSKKVTDPKCALCGYEWDFVWKERFSVAGSRAGQLLDLKLSIDSPQACSAQHPRCTSLHLKGQE